MERLDVAGMCIGRVFCCDKKSARCEELPGRRAAVLHGASDLSSRHLFAYWVFGHFLLLLHVCVCIYIYVCLFVIYIYVYILYVVCPIQVF